ncbi:hypothetical protein [Streptomyces sp. NPDC056255]|uniref:hypothetical protein n=1 Tax=Streptomyces sp. NPDC056255 TaxID=3345764 RepID=UPI0035E009B3
MTASRAFIDNAAGQTALEAMAVGLPVVSYRPIPGYGREGTRWVAEHGLTECAPDPWALIRALDRLTPSGPARERRITTARSLFSGVGVLPLEALVRRS